MRRTQRNAALLLFAGTSVLAACSPERRESETAPSDDAIRPSPGTPEVSPPRLAISVACAWSTACAVFSDGTVWCWGAGTDYGVGDGTTAYPFEIPVQVQIDHVRRLHFSGVHFCAVLLDGSVYCWGSNDFEQLGNKEVLLGSKVPVMVPNVEGVSAMFLSTGTTLALLTDGTLIGWGGIPNGEASTQYYLTADAQTLANNVLSAIAGGGLCYASGLGSVFCMGTNYYGQLGPDNAVLLPSWTPVEGLWGIVGLERGDAYSCGWREDGRVECWGTGLPVVVDGSRDALESPVLLPGFANVVDLEADRHQICAMRDDGEVSCVGTRPGTGNVVDDVATPVPELGPVRSFCLGNSFACAVRKDGPVVCWGDNSSGQLGQKEWSTTPIVVPFPFQQEDGGAP